MRMKKFIKERGSEKAEKKFMNERKASKSFIFIR